MSARFTAQAVNLSHAEATAFWRARYAATLAREEQRSEQ